MICWIVYVGMVLSVCLYLTFALMKKSDYAELIKCNDFYQLMYKLSKIVALVIMLIYIYVLILTLKNNIFYEN